MKMKNEEAIHALDTLVEAYGAAIRALQGAGAGTVGEGGVNDEHG